MNADPLDDFEMGAPLPTVYNHGLVMKHIGEGEIVLDRDSLTTFMGSPVPGRTGIGRVYCRECEEMVAPVSYTERAYDPHCPLCGRQPGALEHGIDSAEEGREIHAGLVEDAEERGDTA